MLSGWESYKGQKYFICRYRKLTLEQLKAEIDEVLAEVTKQPEKSILMLVDVNETIISPSVFDALQSAATNFKQFIKRTAVLGVTGVRRNMLDLLIKVTGLQVVAFEKQEDALEWLIQPG